MLFCTRISRISRILPTALWTQDFLNTNKANNTNIFWHTDLTHGFFALDVWTRILRITRILFGTRISFFLHTDLTNLTDFEPSARCEWQLVGLLTRCGYWLIVVIDLLWLLTCCGYWLVMVIDSLWLLTCCGLNDKSKKISVSHAKHWQIRVLKNIRVIRVIRVQKKSRIQNDECSRWWVVQDDEWFKMMSGSFVVSGFMW